MLRFAVGRAHGPRSRTWRLWVEPGKSDVYIAGRRLGNSVKVSLHEPGPSRFALTREYVRREDAIRLDGDPRGAREWERPRPELPDRPHVRPFAILVPWDEVLERGYPENGDVVWTAPPPRAKCIEYDVHYFAPGLKVEGHVGLRSMGTELVGSVTLGNGSLVQVTAVVAPMDAKGRQMIDQLRGARATDAVGNRVRLSVLAFGVEPDGTGKFMDVTPPWDKGQDQAAEADD